LEAYAARSSAAKPKPKPKPGAAGKDMSPLEKVEKIVSIGQNVFSAANAVWDGVNRTEDYAYYTASLELVNYTDLTVIVAKNSQKRKCLVSFTMPFQRKLIIAYCLRQLR
jgi:hypothetical protein